MVPLTAVALTAAAAEVRRIEGDWWSEQLDSSDGLPASKINSLAQDDRGYLWVSTAGGVARYDGERVFVVTRPGLGIVEGSGVNDRIVLTDSPSTPLIEVDLHGATAALERPPGVMNSAVVDDTGRLWLVADGALYREEAPRGDWRRVDAGWSDPHLVGRGRHGSVLVGDEDQLFRVTPDGAAVPHGRLTHLYKAVERDDGQIVAVANISPWNNLCTLVAMRDGRVEVLFQSGSRVIDLVARGDELLVVSDDQIVRRRGDGPFEVRPNLDCCGGGLVDAAHGVWIAAESGLRHFPSPSTVSYPGLLTIRAALDGDDAIWAATWGGVEHVRLASGAATAERTPFLTFVPCVDAQGQVWVQGRGVTARLHPDGRPPDRFDAPRALPRDCHPGEDGRTWLASHEAIQVLRGGGPPQVVSATPAGTPPVEVSVAVLEHRGAVWLATDARVCRAPVEQVLAGPTADWTCEVVDPPHPILDLEVADDGMVWAAVVGGGVFRHDGAGWSVVPASQSLRVGTLSHFARSPRGGTWVLAEGDLLRVRADASSPNGWRVLERLGGAQGMPAAISPGEVLENARGDLWLTARSGQLFHIPEVEREPLAEPPTVQIVEVTTDGLARDPRAPLTLPFERSNVAVGFSAPNFDGWRMFYQYRLQPGDRWSTPSSESTVHLAALAPGRYRFEVVASRDGREWSANPARYEIEVRWPWVLQPGFVVPAGLVFAASGFGLLRARRAASRRLEGQRARIARDLHDAIGSGLGSIGLLAAMAARRTSDPERTREALRGIAAQATELGDSLTDIVTSLRAGTAHLRALHGHIVERGLRACASGTPRFEARPNDSVPDVPVSLAVRINVLMIAIEVIHNAVRHARATSIRVTLEPVSGRRWVLSIADDGVGLPLEPGSPDPAGRPGGMGLVNCRTRAAEIGARLEWISAPGAGTELRVWFDADAVPEAVRVRPPVRR